ncbi:MAG: peptidase M24 [Isosphaeraceae bacterium]|jgi:Xaa-Pro aminopeptidase|nr:MAG: peptidase M24 [Isosphaeraceae bacterium]
MFDLTAIQAAVRGAGLDGWLLYDFRGSNVLARRVLDLEGRPAGSRRFFYLVPAEGEPTRIVHRIEPAVLDHLPGRTRVYLRWQELEAALAEALSGLGRVAMEYAPGLSNPYISRVDGGTVEAVRRHVGEVVSSGDLIQQFEATWDDEQWAMHLEADRHTRAAFELAWGLIADRVLAGQTVTECEVQRAILEHFDRHGLTTYSPPIVGVNAHGADPHFENSPANDTAIREGDFVLLDLWAKLDRPRAVYSDLTRVAYVGDTVPERYESVFAVVAAARDAAIEHVRTAFAAGRRLPAWEVDDAARRVIEAAGYGDRFVHRTGHNIGQEVHGNGAAIDNLETHEERLILPRTCFSIEPGIYLDDFGVRSEVDVFVDAQGQVHVTGGPPQQRVVALLREYGSRHRS